MIRGMEQLSPETSPADAKRSLWRWLRALGITLKFLAMWAFQPRVYYQRFPDESSRVKDGNGDTPQNPARRRWRTLGRLAQWAGDPRSYYRKYPDKSGKRS